MTVRAGVGLPVPFPSAVPVQAQHGGVVPERPPDGAQDGSGDLLDHLTRVQVAGGRQQTEDVGGRGVAFEYAIGDDHEAVAGQQRHRLHPVVAAGHYPERRIGGQLDVLHPAVADPERAGVPGVDHGAGAGGQIDPEELAGDELVDPAVLEDCRVGARRLLGQSRTTAPAVAQAADQQRRQ